jgi:hypothetical protein
MSYVFSYPLTYSPAFRHQSPIHLFVHIQATMVSTLVKPADVISFLVNKAHSSNRQQHFAVNLRHLHSRC